VGGVLAARAVGRGWSDAHAHHLDAHGKVLGRLATRAAVLLRGKHKREFTRSLDCGDFVVVTNAAKVRVTGQKEKAKTSAQPKKPVKSKESAAQQKPKAPTPKETGEKPEVKKKEPAKAKSGKTGGTKSKSEKAETTQTKSVKAKTTKAKTTKAKAEPKE